MNLRKLPFDILQFGINPFLTYPLHLIYGCKEWYSVVSWKNYAVNLTLRSNPRMLISCRISSEGTLVLYDHHFNQEQSFIILQTYFQSDMSRGDKHSDDFCICSRYALHLDKCFNIYQQMKMGKPDIKLFITVYDPCGPGPCGPTTHVDGKQENMRHDFPFVMEAVMKWNFHKLLNYFQILMWHLLSYEQIMEIFKTVLYRFRFDRKPVWITPYQSMVPSVALVETETIYDLVRTAETVSSNFVTVVNPIIENQAWTCRDIQWSWSELQQLRPLTRIPPPLKTWVYSNPQLLQLLLSADPNVLDNQIHNHFRSKIHCLPEYISRSTYLKFYNKSTEPNKWVLFSNPKFLKSLIDINPYVLFSNYLKLNCSEKVIQYAANLTFNLTVSDYKEKMKRPFCPIPYPRGKDLNHIPDDFWDDDDD